MSLIKDHFVSIIQDSADEGAEREDWEEALDTVYPDEAVIDDEEAFYQAESRARDIIAGADNLDVDFGDDGDAPVTLTVNELLELVTRGVMLTK